MFSNVSLLTVSHCHVPSELLRHAPGGVRRAKPPDHPPLAPVLDYDQTQFAKQAQVR